MQFLSSSLQDYYPELRELKQEDFIFSKWAGIRPLVRSAPVAEDQQDKSGKNISRRHVITESNSGLISVMGGKWTIYRKMGEEALLKILKRSSPHLTEVPEEISTRHLRLIGDFRNKTASDVPLNKKRDLEDYQMTFAKHLYSRFSSLGLGLLNHLAWSYGVRSLDIIELISKDPKLVEKVHPSFEITRAEIIYQIRNEMVVNVFDLLLRRNRLAFLDRISSEQVMPILIDILGDENKWSDSTKRANLKQARELFARMQF